MVRDGIGSRLNDSVETALRLADGLVTIERVDLEADDPARERRYSERRSCPNDHPLALEEIEPRTFSFNAPYGACPECDGIGSRLVVDPELVVPDPALTLREGAVAPWTSHQDFFTRQLESLGEDLGFDVDTPWKDLPEPAREAILSGKDYKVRVTYRNRWGKERTYGTGFEGVLSYVMRKHDETESDWSRERYEGYMRTIACPACKGARLRPEVLAVRIDGRNIDDVCQLSIAEAKEFADTVRLTERQARIAAQVLKEVRLRLGFLVDVGLTYLSLARGAATLSGGEAQRVKLASELHRRSSGRTVYILDEPTTGLHFEDVRKLLAVLQSLVDKGNTVIVIEHNLDVIKSADWIVDMGPEGGSGGGLVVAEGTPEQVAEAEGSHTGRFLAPLLRQPLLRR